MIVNSDPEKFKLDHYGTHVPVLAAAKAQMDGSCHLSVELGVGFYSTPLLHEMCLEGINGKVISAESDEVWLNYFKDRLESNFHDFIKVDDWYDYSWADGLDPDLLFVDQTYQQRANSLLYFKNKAAIIVVHDLYFLERDTFFIFDEFRYVKKFPLYDTVFLSNFRSW